MKANGTLNVQFNAPLDFVIIVRCIPLTAWNRERNFHEFINIIIWKSAVSFLFVVRFRVNYKKANYPGVIVYKVSF